MEGMKQIASPKWDFDDATSDRSGASFENPDHVSIVIHNYRWRLGLAEGESKMAIWRNGSPKVQSSPSPPLPSKVMPTVHPTRAPVPMPGNSQANMRTRSSRAALGTTCRRKSRRPLQKLSSK
jgi:hypothetical protein